VVRTRRFILFAGALLAASALVGCAGASSPSAPTEADLVGTWALDEEFSSPEQPFIAFSEDGSWIASDGCNQVRGTWQLGEDGSLLTTSGPSTLMACEGAQLPLAMAQATAVEIDGELLILTSSGESTTTVLVRSTDPAVGPQGLPIGRWIESNTAGAPFLDFSADGSLSGNDGCNSMVGGTWVAASDGSVELTMGASTRMFCDGVDTWLNLATKGRILAQTMTLEDATGAVLGQLVAE
jgi:heat shock protein HslJ